MSTRAVREFPRDPGSAADARRWAVEQCPPWAHGDIAEDLRLIVSELVANVVEHGVGPPILSLTSAESVIRLEVSDRGHGPIAMGAPSPGSEHGRGLRIVDALSTQWGTSHSDAWGNVVWAEIRR